MKGGTAVKGAGQTVQTGPENTAMRTGVAGVCFAVLEAQASSYPWEGTGGVDATRATDT